MTDKDKEVIIINDKDISSFQINDLIDKYAQNDEMMSDLEQQQTNIGKELTLRGIKLLHMVLNVHNKYASKNPNLRFYKRILNMQNPDLSFSDLHILNMSGYTKDDFHGYKVIFLAESVLYDMDGRTVHNTFVTIESKYLSLESLNDDRWIYNLYESEKPAFEEKCRLDHNKKILDEINTLRSKICDLESQLK